MVFGFAAATAEMRASPLPSRDERRAVGALTLTGVRRTRRRPRQPVPSRRRRWGRHRCCSVTVAPVSAARWVIASSGATGLGHAVPAWNWPAFRAYSAGTDTAGRRVGRGRPDDGDRTRRGRQRQHATVVLQQHRTLRGDALSHGTGWLGRGARRRGRRQRVIEQARFDVGADDTERGCVDLRRSDLPGIDGRIDVRRRVELRPVQLLVEAVAQRGPGGVHGAEVGHDVPVEAASVPFSMLLRMWVLARVRAVDLVVGAHDAARRALADRDRER